MKYKIVIMYDKEYQGYVVDVPELVGCMSQGKTLDDALTNVKDAIQGWLHVEETYRHEERNQMDKQELLRLIAQAAAEGWTSLDLSNRGLTELPPEIRKRGVMMANIPQRSV
jgi:predicted RNase H-like HicB family nuclease